MKTQFPLFYFHSTICWVDDDHLFIEAVRATFAENYNCITFPNPEKAINFLENYRAPLSNIGFTRELRESDVHGTHDHFPIDLNISEMSKLINIPNRADEISVLIVDYNMPAMNGLDLCKKLKDLPAKKILLTGEADLSPVIDAFNQGLINRYIKKDNGIADKLEACIKELNYSYFSEMTAHLMAHLEASRPSPLSDIIFTNFFYEWCRANNIIEFALINKQGSFLLKNAQGAAQYLIVMNEYEKNEFLQLHDDVKEARELLEQLSAGKMIPFFGPGKESWQVDVDQWSSCFYSANILQGREKYYWAVVK